MMKLTLWGMNDYLDGKLLDFLPTSLPEGTFDAALMEELIYMECGDLFPYYQVPSYCKAHIKNFFDRNAEQFKRVWEALFSEYNPIENYDRIEAWSDSHSESTMNSMSASQSESLSMSSSESVSAVTSSSDSQSSSSRGDVSAFNAATMQPQSASQGQAATTGTTNNDTRGTSSSLRSAYTLNGQRDTKDMKALDSHRGRVHGNIGVTTSQQMIQQSIELGSYDIYIWVIALFKKNIISSIL